MSMGLERELCQPRRAPSPTLPLYLVASCLAQSAFPHISAPQGNFNWQEPSGKLTESNKVDLISTWTLCACL